VKLLSRIATALLCVLPLPALAQEPEPLRVPSTASEPQGVVPEPDFITRAVLFADRQLGKGDLTNGIYLDYANMIPGAGWGAIGPGYRHWYNKDSLFIDGSASISVNAYKMAQARVELPTLLKSRVSLGLQARYQDFGNVDFFGAGPDSSPGLKTDYAIRSTQLAAFLTLRPLRWFSVDAQAGWMNPDARFVQGATLRGFRDQREYLPVDVSMVVDTRDFPNHPTRGVLVRAIGSRYEDRTDGTFTFNRYQGEAAGFAPIAGGRIVLALHGWAVRSDVDAGHAVPFYFQPSLGGVNSLRSYTDYRFHDDNMLLATAEVRLALMSHLDLAMFADAGNVAQRSRDLNLDKQSFGTGLRLHTRRDTFAMLDVANGDEGWLVAFRLRDPLQLGRLSRKTTVVPLVP